MSRYSMVSANTLLKGSVTDGKEKYDAYCELSRIADSIVVDVFNNCYESLYSSEIPARRRFQLNTLDITKHRRVLERWTPQMYGPDLGIMGFDVPYALSAYFKRYISFSETHNAKQLETSAAIKLLRVNKEGENIDGYVLNHPSMKRLMDKMRYHIGVAFDKPLRLSDIYRVTGHGPNSTTDVSLREAYLHIKDLQFVGTKPALQQFIHYLHWDDKAREMIIKENDIVRGAVNGVDQELDQFVVDVANVSLVPKSAKELRTMRPEGTVSAWFAQGIAKIVTDILRVYCNISLESQPEVHRALSRLGSLYSDLLIGTIDWSGASDRIWTTLVQELFTEAYAPQWYDFMYNVCRVGKSRMSFTVSSSEFNDELLALLDDVCIEYDMVQKGTSPTADIEITCLFEGTMFANMGNPITFPLQTLIFWVFLTSCGEIYCEDNAVDYDTLQWPSCFGDDGIIDSRIFSIVEHYAPLLGWKLNKDKSFVEGGFRESCGGDYYYGRYVRPFSIKRPPLAPYYNPIRNKKVLQAWTYILFNNMFDLLERCGAPQDNLFQLLEIIHDDLRLGKICLVPPCFSEGSGIRVTAQFKSSDDLTSFVGPIAPSQRNCFGFFDFDVEKYHTPVWQENEQAWSFRYISNDPDKIGLDVFYHDHYLHHWLKMRQRTDDTASYHKAGFFDSHKELALLDNNGDLNVKEFKPAKTKQLVTTWY